MINIPYVEVYEREGMDRKIIQSYPFPDVDVFYLTDCWVQNIMSLKSGILMIKDINIRLSQERRLSFILDIWHPKNFVDVNHKGWKYG